TAPLEPDTYHLAHCRAVLIHMPEPQLVVRRMVEALQIGGWLLIEEPDLSSLRAADATHPLAESFDRQYRETCDRVAPAKLADPYLGHRVHRLLEDAGLTEIESEGVSRIVQGGGAEARRNCMSLQAFVERGILSHTEYADLQSAFLAPRFSFI